MSSVFSSLKPRNSVERNGFDLSRRSVFSAKCGQIIPVFAQATLPDSEYRIDLKQLLRTQPLQTAAFTGFSINYDFFFVPNNYGYSSFNEFISQREDSRHVGQPSLSDVPVIPFKNFLSDLLSLAAWDYLISDHFNPVGYVKQMSDVGGNGCFLITTPNVPWISVLLECVRSLDMFGYGNYLPLVKSYSQVLYDFMTDGGTNIPQSFADWLLLVEAKWAVPAASWTFDMIWQNLGQFFESNSGLVPVANSQFPSVNPTVWPFLAYNKAFYEYYRNEYYDTAFTLTFQGATRTHTFNYDYVELFNLDDWVSNAYSSNLQVWFPRFLAIFVPKNHLYKKDLFTGVLPSTQFGDVSVMMDNRDWLDLYSKVGSDVTSTSRYLINPQSFSDGTAKITSRITIGGSNADTKFRFDPGLAIGVLEQRRADAMQRFKERMLRAGNKVKDVFKAHGWSEPYSANESSPVFLGTFDGRLDINTVASTTETDNLELGQLAANGTGVVNGSRIQFKCHDFGYIVGVFYIVKDAEIDAYGIEKQHCLTDPFDYPYPELQNISLHPVDNLELSIYNMTDNLGSLRQEILGYLPRFMEYKTAVDKVHGEFYSSQIVPPFDSFDYLNRDSNVGVFSDWVTPRQDLSNPTALGFLYQSPFVADNIFKQQATALQSSDQFLVNCLFDVMAVEPVSVIGLPI